MDYIVGLTIAVRDERSRRDDEFETPRVRQRRIGQINCRDRDEAKLVANVLGSDSRLQYNAQPAVKLYDADRRGSVVITFDMLDQLIEEYTAPVKLAAE